MTIFFILLSLLYLQIPAPLLLTRGMSYTRTEENCGLDFKFPTSGLAGVVKANSPQAHSREWRNLFLPQLLSHEWRNSDHTPPQYGYNIPMLKVKI